MFDDLLGQVGSGCSEEVPLSWLEPRPYLLAELHEIGRPDSRRLRFVRDWQHYTVLEGLYALSRIIDVLIAAHQPSDDDPALLNWTTGKPWWPGELPAASTWRAFVAAIGAVPVDQSSFHPFFHEIVTVQPSDDPDEAPVLIAEHWPGAIVGSLLLARAGVTVRAGAHHIDAVVAARSGLYWAWWRRNRPTIDLSHGWGHNSEWATDFRRDYVIDGHLHYNVDADQAGPRHSDLAVEGGLDLLRHRCSVHVDLGKDQWPFADTVVEPAP